MARPETRARSWIPTHRHHKRGSSYRILTRGLREHDLEPVAIYEAPDGTVWCRPAREFDDGERFQRLPATAPEPVPDAPGATADTLTPEDALAGLLAAGAVTLSGARAVHPGTPSEIVSAVYARCPDAFGRPDDLEPVPPPELPGLYRAHASHGALGVIRWAALHRQRRPVAGTVAALQAAGLWDAPLDTLAP